MNACQIKVKSSKITVRLGGCHPGARGAGSPSWLFEEAHSFWSKQSDSANGECEEMEIIAQGTLLKIL